MAQGYLDCRSVRELVSLELDLGLSELETVLVGSHLRRCPSCERFAAEIRGVTVLIRAVQLEPVTQPVTLPRLRRAVVRQAAMRLAQASSAAIAVVAVGLAFAGSPDVDRTGERALVAAPLTDPAALNEVTRDLRRADLGSAALTASAVDGGPAAGSRKPLAPLAS
jgi:predicted anti-sigma-YlaC factor YlaD